jgi:hypothetical protein
MIQDLSRDEVDRIMNTLKKEKGKHFFNCANLFEESDV